MLYLQQQCHLYSDDWLIVQKALFDDDDDSVNSLEKVLVQRSLDSNNGWMSSDFSKRRFDKIGSYSSFGGLQKRIFDRIGDASAMGGLSKKSAPDSSPFEARQLRKFDRIAGMSSLGGLSKKTSE